MGLAAIRIRHKELEAADEHGHIQKITFSVKVV